MGKRAAADINVKHNLAVQRFSRPPYDLKTRVIVVSHPEGFLATLEWKWKDPNRDGRTLVAVTSGINGNRKLAMSEAYRAMLTKQKLLDDSETAQKEALVELEEHVQLRRFSQAVKLLLQAATHSNLSIKSVGHMFPTVWRHVMAEHDHRLSESLLAVLERAGTVPVTLYENLIQELVYLSDFTFAESILVSMASDRIKLEIPDRGLLAQGEVTTPFEVSKWKYWRSLVAIEELTNIHSALNNRDLLPSFSLKVEEGTTLPFLKMNGLIDDSSPPVESLVLLSTSEKSDYLTGRVEESSVRPDGVTVLTVKLLTEEQSHGLITQDFLTVTILSESRVTFDRINTCLREFYHMSPVPEMNHRFDGTIRNLLLNYQETKMKSNTMVPVDLTKEKRFLNLSEAQLAAVVHAISYPLTLIHGPAGTGKTHTLCGIVSSWRSINDNRILCCADSNTATDNIYEALKRRNIPAFRLGSWKSLTDVAEETLSALPNKTLVDRYRSAVFAFRADDCRKTRNFLIGARKQIEEEAVRFFKVVVTTLSSARNPVLDKVIFPNVIIDEGAQTIEPAALLAISHGCERLVLVGDHKQLPAVVLSRTAIEKGFNISLFQRLMNENASAVLLNIQRRMHPSISAWPNTTFYEGKLEDHACTVTEKFLDGHLKRFPWLTTDKRVVLIDTEGTGTGEELVGTSTRNTSECSILAEVIERIVRSEHVRGSQMGVIVPYLAQRHALISELKRRNLLNTGVQINTVEGFQGHERDLMIISTTRSNAVGSLGFLEDDQRMNVMLTRARKGLVVVCDRETLKKRKNSRWSSYMDWCESNAAIVSMKQFNSV